MKDVIIPLVSPLSRKYYDYASEQNERKHHRAEDVRICLEYICDHLIFIFVSDQDKKKWKKYKLHDKLKASENFLDEKLVDKLISAKIIGNEGVHKGEEGDYTEQDIIDSLNAIKEFSLEIFYEYFKRNGFDCHIKSWIPTVFSTLPPIYRIRILEKYYNNCNKSQFVIDKLSKAYLKGGLEDEAREFLTNCYKKKEITAELYEVLNNGISLLKRNISKLPIAMDLEDSKKNFNKLLSVIEESERDIFICLMSIILNG